MLLPGGNVDVVLGLAGVAVGFLLSQFSTVLRDRAQRIRRDNAAFFAIEPILAENETALAKTRDMLAEEISALAKGKQLQRSPFVPRSGLVPLLGDRLPDQVAKNPDWLMELWVVGVGVDAFARGLEDRRTFDFNSMSMTHHFTGLRAYDADLAPQAAELHALVERSLERVRARRAEKTWLVR